MGYINTGRKCVMLSCKKVTFFFLENKSGLCEKLFRWFCPVLSLHGEGRGALGWPDVKMQPEHISTGTGCGGPAPSSNREKKSWRKLWWYSLAPWYNRQERNDQLTIAITTTSFPFKYWGAATTTPKALKNGVMFMKMLSSVRRTACPVSPTPGAIREAQVTHSSAERTKHGPHQSRAEVLTLASSQIDKTTSKYSFETVSED